MKQIIVVFLIFLQLSGHMHFSCFSDRAEYQVDLSKHVIKKEDNFAYHYQIHNHDGAVTIVRNQNGTFFMGDFSTLQLTTKQRTYHYSSTGFSFKYPPQHKIANLTRETLEMQIVYELQRSNQMPWKHNRVIVSVSFVQTDYAPPQIDFTLAKQINRSITNETTIDLKKLLPLLPQLDMVLYKGRHSDHPEDDNCLWLIRKELLLMGDQEFTQVKDLIFQHISKQNTKHHGLIKRTSELYIIRQFTPIIHS